MKTLQLLVIAILSVVVFSSSLAYAEQPLLDFYNNSQLVLVGKIISLSQVPTTTSNPSQSPNQTRYDIQVEQYYKNPQAAKLITVYGYAKGIYFSQDPTYNVGDRVFLYLNQENGYYQIQSHSFALNNDCDARPMIPMPTLPFEPPPISTPADGYVFDFQSTSGTHNDTFGLGDKIHINFVAENYLPVIKYATLNFTIKTENNTKLIFNDTKHITIPACNGSVPVSWDFVPKSSGTYFVNVNMSSSVNLRIQTVLFTEPSLGSSFDVRENISGISIEKAPYQSSPLTQLKSGIAANNVICKAGLQLIIKAEDGSPACVKYTTANVLIERGWAREAIPTMTSLETTVIIPVNSSLLYNGFTFMPSIVKTVIGINNTVRWINMDSVNNDITSDTGAFKSAFIVSGYAWTHTFDKAGTYGYHSVIHPWLKGTVIVVGNNTLPASFMPCDTTFPPNNVGFPINEKNIPVLYMPTNSIGKICVTYSNPNNTTQTLSTAITIHDPNNSYQQVQDISAWTVYGFPTVSGKGNSTFVYEIKTGNQTGFYGLSFYCMGIPFAVGYNNDSTIVSNDFPWIGKDYSCPVLTYDFHIDSLTGIGLRHIPYP